MEEKIVELLKDEELVKKLEETQNPEEMMEMLKNFGMDEETAIEFIKAPLEQYIKEHGDEMNEEDLEGVAGGIRWNPNPGPLPNNPGPLPKQVIECMPRIWIMNQPGVNPFGIMTGFWKKRLGC